MNRFKVFGCAFGSVLLLIAGAMLLFDVHYNVSRSMPFGFYRIVSGTPVVGDLVVFDLPADSTFYPLAKERKYPVCNLLKQLVAIEGDSLKISVQGIEINDSLYRGSHALLTDSAGRPLPVYLNSGVLPEGQGLALSGFCVDSFDGRYFGSVPMAVLKKVVPVFIFNHWSSYAFY